MNLDPVILYGAVGSTAYGLATEGSDVDWLGVMVADTDDVLGLDGPNAVARSLVTKNPDSTVHELGKFCRLALSCNPTVMELLWLADYQSIDEHGQALVDARCLFLSTSKVRAAYGGYATQQARKLLDRHRDGRPGFASDLANRTEKHGRHCWRLMLVGEQLLTTGRLMVDVSEWRDDLFDMGRLAATDPEAFHARFEDRRSQFDSMPSVLPDEPDRDAINRLLVSIRRDRVT